MKKYVKICVILYNNQKHKFTRQAFYCLRILAAEHEKITKQKRFMQKIKIRLVKYETA